LPANEIDSVHRTREFPSLGRRLYLLKIRSDRYYDWRWARGDTGATTRTRWLLGAVCALGDQELLRHLTPEMTLALGELYAHFMIEQLRGSFTGVDVLARGAVCALGGEGAAAATSTGVDVHARGAVYTLGNAAAAEAPDTGATIHARR
jgi:hypothetical protein